MKNFFSLSVMILCSQWLLGQSLTITGTVTDSGSGEPLIGATVLVQNTQIGVVTDINGTYTIEVPGSAEALSFTYVGYETKDVPINGRINVDVTLAIAAEQLEEIVVVGYGEQKKVNLTGAIENVSVADSDTRVLTDASQLIQGKVSGIQITQNSGQPGSQDAEIRIRGVASIENSNQPLVIIDGVYGNLSDVHPNDIETMTVLKDASAAAIYGVRASAGVILIKTKRGKEKLSVNFNTSLSVSSPTQLPEPVDGITYAERLNEARINFGFAPQYDQFDLDSIRNNRSDRFQNNDWYDLFFRDGNVQNHYLSVSGGSENHDFSISGGHLDQEGILFGTSSNKLSYRAVLNAYFADDRIRIGGIVQGYDEGVEELSSPTTSVLTQVSLISPLAAFSFDDDRGNTFYTFNSRYFVEEERGGGRFLDRRNYKYQFEGEVELLPQLSVLSRYSQNIYISNRERLVPEILTASGPELEFFQRRRSSTERNLSETRRTLWTNLLRYNWSLGEAHQFSALAGYERNYEHNETLLLGTNDLLANEPVISLGDPAEIYYNDGEWEVAQVSYFGRLTYNFAERYLFEANFRRDASSRFNPAGNASDVNTPFATFPSFSFAWRLSEEPFFQNELFSSVKFRASWGQLGNDNIRDRYPLFSEQTPDFNYSFGGQLAQGSATTKISAPVFWEKTEQINLGVDVEMLGRISLSANYYNKSSIDNLIRVTVPLSLGTSELPFQNIGKMRNEGLEATLSFRSHSRRVLSFFSTLNVNYNRNIILDLGDVNFVRHDEDVVSGYLPPAGIIRSVVGSSFASFYGYRVDGIYQVDDFTWQNDSDPEIPHLDRRYRLREGLPSPFQLYANAAPGDIKYTDLNGDGELNEADITEIGSSQPDWVYSGSFGFSYKNFTLSTLVQGIGGVEAYLIGGLISPFWGGRAPINQELSDNRWTFENPSETTERLHVDSKRANIVSEYYIQDASYFRVENVRLEYNFPREMVERIKLSRLRLFVTAENILTITNYEGFDPERSTFKITSDFHPQVQTYSFGLNASF